MKISQLATCLLALALFLTAGCGKKKESAQGEDAFGINKLVRVFADASAPQKQVIEKVGNAIKGQDYGAASDALQGLARNPSLNSDQTQAIKETLAVLGNYPRRAP